MSNFLPFLFFFFQELLSLAKRKRVDSEEPEEPVSKPAASTDSETSDSDDEVLHRILIPLILLCRLCPEMVLVPVCFLNSIWLHFQAGFVFLCSLKCVCM